MAVIFGNPIYDPVNPSLSGANPLVSTPAPTPQPTQPNFGNSGEDASIHAGVGTITSASRLPNQAAPPAPVSPNLPPQTGGEGQGQGFTPQYFGNVTVGQGGAPVSQTHYLTQNSAKELANMLGGTVYEEPMAGSPGPSITAPQYSILLNGRHLNAGLVADMFRRDPANAMNRLMAETTYKAGNTYNHNQSQTSAPLNSGAANILAQNIADSSDPQRQGNAPQNPLVQQNPMTAPPQQVFSSQPTVRGFNSPFSQDYSGILSLLALLMGGGNFGGFGGGYQRPPMFSRSNPLANFYPRFY